MQVYRGLDIGTAKPTPAERAAVPHHLDRRRRPDGGVVGRGARRTRRAPRSPTSRRAGSARCSSAAPASTCRRSSTTLAFPPTDPAVRAALDDATAERRRPRAAPTPARPSSIRSPPPRIEPGNRRRIVRALEVIELTGQPFSSFGPGHRRRTAAPAFPVTHGRHRRSTAPVLRGAHRRALRRDARRGPGRRGARRSRPGRCSRTAAPGDRLPGGARPPRGRAARSTTRSTRPSAAPAASPAASACGSGATRASRGCAAPTIRRRASPPSRWHAGATPRPLSRRRHDRPPPRRSCTPPATTSSCRSSLDAAERRARRRSSCRRSATGTAASAPTA